MKTIEQLKSAKKELKKDLQIWQSMLENAKLIHSIAANGKEFGEEIKNNAFIQLTECSTRCSRIQRSIDQITNEIKAR